MAENSLWDTLIKSQLQYVSVNVVPILLTPKPSKSSKKEDSILLPNLFKQCKLETKSHRCRYIDSNVGFYGQPAKYHGCVNGDKNCDVSAYVILLEPQCLVLGEDCCLRRPALLGIGFCKSPKGNYLYWYRHLIWFWCCFFICMMSILNKETRL